MGDVQDLRLEKKHQLFAAGEGIAPPSEDDLVYAAENKGACDNKYRFLPGIIDSDEKFVGGKESPGQQATGSRTEAMRRRSDSDSHFG